MEENLLDNLLDDEAKKLYNKPESSLNTKFLKNEFFIGDGIVLSLKEKVGKITSTFKNEKTGEYPEKYLFTFFNEIANEQTMETSVKNGKRMLEAIIKAGVRIGDKMILKAEKLDEYNYSWECKKLEDEKEENPLDSMGQEDSPI
jgi:hypothetical protein